MKILYLLNILMRLQKIAEKALCPGRISKRLSGQIFDRKGINLFVLKRIKDSNYLNFTKSKKKS